MENKIVLFSNIKGGVGKTTLLHYLQVILLKIVSR